MIPFPVQKAEHIKVVYLKVKILHHKMSIIIIKIEINYFPKIPYNL